jgi:hypothetical protein
LQKGWLLFVNGTIPLENVARDYAIPSDNYSVGIQYTQKLSITCTEFLGAYPKPSFTLKLIFLDSYQYPLTSKKLTRKQPITFEIPHEGCLINMQPFCYIREELPIKFKPGSD